MDEKLRKDVEAVVATIFSEQEEAEIRKQTEEALGKSATTIEELTTALEAKNSEFEELEAKLSESEDKAKDLTTELEAAQEKIEKATKKSDEAEGALEEIKKDRATELRMKELEEAGVVSDEETQSSKVREMSDEDFTSYRDELVSIREAVIAELSKAAEGETKEEKAAREKQEQEDADKVAADAAAEAAAAEEGGEEGDIQTPPANIDPGTAISAALNLEVFPPKEMTEKYGEMGKAMAKLFEEKTD
jgi:chromosome segregation ATPase